MHGIILRLITSLGSFIQARNYLKLFGIVRLKIWPKMIEKYRKIQNKTEPIWTKLSDTELSWIKLNKTDKSESDWIKLNETEPIWTKLSHTESNWTKLKQT